MTRFQRLKAAILDHINDGLMWMGLTWMGPPMGQVWPPPHHRWKSRSGSQRAEPPPLEHGADHD